jgi:O-antigen/teichoic acid export membrane protein
LLHFGARTQGLSVAYFVNQRIDQLVLSLLVTPKELGLYAVAVSLSTSIAFLPQAAGIVAFSRGSGQHVEEAMQTAGVAFRTSLIWLLIVCVLLFAIAPQLIRIVFGPTFEGSILACRILLPGALVTGLNFVLYSAASALGRPGLASYAEGASVLVTTVGLYLLVPRYGYVGAAIVSSAAYTVSFVIMLTLAHRCLNLSLKSLIVASRYP